MTLCICHFPHSHPERSGWESHFFSKLLFRQYDIAKLVIKKDCYNIDNFIIYKKKNPPDGRFFRVIL